ncbi:hypothetical protein G7Y89_g3277 [Cudoniella acicularis]|uniref:Rhodopsin domain-containing protein n=1 Tax=Cudoniella acicularis TaxID=354080 RepID=A0A8H4W5C1_9HELO|nr:hypothetical protein G7Y89_g3277 [Cudoniella acicularis]
MDTTTSTNRIDRSAIISIVTWFLLVTSILATTARLATKRAVNRTWNRDDGFAILALIFTVGSGIAVSVQAANGLGKPISSLSAHELAVFSKSGYASEMLYIATLCAAKLSVVMLLRLILPGEEHQKLGAGLEAFIVVWWIVAEIATAFQCSTPQSWNIFGNKCFDRVAFWQSVATVNIFTDIILIVTPILVFTKVQMNMGKKFIVISCFGSRVFDIIATSLQLAFTKDFQSSDVTFILWHWVLLTQIAQCITIITSCVPYLRPLLVNIPSGMLMSDELRRRGYDVINSGSGNNTFGIRSTKTTSLADRLQVSFPSTAKTHTPRTVHDQDAETALTDY